MLKWQIGDVTITRIVEMEVSLPSEFLFDETVSAERIQEIGWLRPHFAEESGDLKVSVHALIIETPTLRIIVDTCIGNSKPREVELFAQLQTSFLSDLKAAGFPPDSFDYVMCTHLHVDHVGWNTMLVDERWVPTFPRAKYLFGRTEFEYWRKESEQSKDDNVAAYQDSVKPVWDAGLVELVDADYRLCEEVSLVPTFGHSPGHVSIRIHSNGEEALITGDFTHHPCQMARPEWASHLDFDQTMSTSTRRTMYEELANTKALVIGTHFAEPTAGHVVCDGEAYRLVVE